MQVKYITYGQLLALCQNHKYLLLRRASGRASVLNCGLAKVAQLRVGSGRSEYFRPGFWLIECVIIMLLVSAGQCAVGLAGFYLILLILVR